MNSLQKIIESKQALRRELAARSVAEKLQILDVMRERRDVMLRGQPRAAIPKKK